MKISAHQFRCPPDCPKRSITCHSDCPTYKEDCEINARKKALKESNRDIDVYLRDRAIKNSVHRAMSKKRKHNGECNK